MSGHPGKALPHKMIMPSAGLGARPPGRRRARDAGRLSDHAASPTARPPIPRARGVRIGQIGRRAGSSTEGDARRRGRDAARRCGWDTSDTGSERWLSFPPRAPPTGWRSPGTDPLGRSGNVEPDTGGNPCGGADDQRHGRGIPYRIPFVFRCANTGRTPTPVTRNSARGAGGSRRSRSRTRARTADPTRTRAMRRPRRQSRTVLARGINYLGGFTPAVDILKWGNALW